MEPVNNLTIHFRSSSYVKPKVKYAKRLIIVYLSMTQLKKTKCRFSEWYWTWILRWGEEQVCSRTVIWNEEETLESLGGLSFLWTPAGRKELPTFRKRWNWLSMTGRPIIKEIKKSSSHFILLISSFTNRIKFYSSREDKEKTGIKRWEICETKWWTTIIMLSNTDIKTSHLPK